MRTVEEQWDDLQQERDQLKAQLSEALAVLRELEKVFHCPLVPEARRPRPRLPGCEALDK